MALTSLHFYYILIMIGCSPVLSTVYNPSIFKESLSKENLQNHTSTVVSFIWDSIHRWHWKRIAIIGDTEWDYIVNQVQKNLSTSWIPTLTIKLPLPHTSRFEFGLEYSQVAIIMCNKTNLILFLEEMHILKLMKKVYWYILNFTRTDLPNSRILGLDNSILTAEFHDNLQTINVDEIYWCPGKENGSNKNPQAIWTSDRGIQAFYNYFHQPRDLGGVSLNIAVCKKVKYWEPNFNNEAEGFLAEVIATLQKHFNFRINVKHQFGYVCPYGVYNDTSKQWSGILRLLHDKDIDMAVVLFMATIPRMKIAEFSIPIDVDRLLPMVRKRNQPFGLVSFLKSFDWQVWVLTGIAILLLAIGISFAFSFNADQSTKSRIMYFFYWLFAIFCAVCQKGVTTTGQSCSVTVMSLTMYIFTLLFYYSYSSCMTSLFTVDTDGVPFTSMQDALNYPEYSFAVLNIGIMPTHIQYSKVEEFQKIWKLMMKNKTHSLIPTYAEGIRRMDAEKLVMVGTLRGMYLMLLNSKRTTDFELLKKIRDLPLSLTFPKDSPYTKLIDSGLYRMRDSGLIHRLLLKINPEFKEITIPGEHLSAISLKHVGSYFYLMLLLMPLVIIAYAYERKLRRIS